MLSIKYFFTLIFCLTLISAKSQEKLTLDSIISIIKKENQDLKYFDQIVLSQNAKVEGANSWMAPMVGAGTFMTPYPGQKTMHNGDKGSVMVSAEQSFPSPAKIKAQKNYLSSQNKIILNQKDLTFNNLKSLAKQNYYDIVINELRIKQLEENLQILNNLKKLGEIRYEYNRGSLSQIFKAESKTYDVQNQLEDATGNIKIGKINLNILMNKNPEDKLELNTNTSLTHSSLLKIDTNYILNTSELKMTLNEIKSMESEAKLIATEAKPEFRLKLDHMSPLSNSMPQQYSVMGMVSIPIAPWSSKAYKSELKTNKLEIDALERRKNAQLKSSYGMIKSLQEKIGNMQSRIEMYKNKILPVNKKNLDVLLLNYQENKEELPMVIDAWEMLNEAQLMYLNELSNYYKMLVEYEKSIEK